ncbi:MAG: C10 family peptidase [Candidatus Zixiibacteriota bacterium]
MNCMKFVFTILLLGTIILAEPVDIEMAQKAADFHLLSHEDFWHRDGGGVPSALMLGYNTSKIDTVFENNEILAYVFHLEPTGFIIVSAYTEFPPVYGFSFRNSFSMREHPLNAGLHNVKWDLGRRLEHMDKIDRNVINENMALWESHLSNDSELLELYSDMEIYGPLLDTDWNQSAPYNDYCPIDPETGETSVVGCVATAMAMVINYYEWPPSVHFDALDDFRKERGDTFLYVEAEAATMDTIDYNGAGIHPTDSVIAMLSFACGVSVEMNYHSDGSGAWVNAAKMMNKWQFGYARNIKGDDEDYNSKLANSIMNNDPALMSIYDADWGSGHKINADGYNSDTETFHLNFGWGGPSNGWYSLPRGMPVGYVHTGNTSIDFELPRYRTVRVPDDFATIQEAIDSSWSGDTIIVADGTYTGDGNRDIEFGGKAIYLRSENGPDVTILDAEAASDDRHRNFLIEKNEGPRCVIDGFTMRGGVTWDGPGIYVKNSSPTFKNCIIEDQTSWSQGGGAYLNRSDSRFYNVIFARNSSAWGGGAWLHRSRIAFVNCVFYGNSGRFAGAAYIQNDSKAAFLNSIIYNNTAEQTKDEIHTSFTEDKPCTLRFSHSNIRSEEVGIEEGAGHIQWGDGMLNISPGFSHDSFRPEEDSYMINTGGNNIFSIIDYYASGYDIVGTERTGLIDIGAYETDFAHENRAPNIWQYPSHEIIRAGHVLDIEFQVSDPEDDRLSFSIDGPEDALLADDETVVWETDLGDTGSYEIHIYATDSILADTAIVLVEVVNGYCGNVAGRWTADDSPIMITCDTWIGEGDTLIIEPDCDVIFTGHYYLEIADGAVFKAISHDSSEAITFSYGPEEDLTDESGGFASLRFNNASDACSLKNCIFEGGNARTNLPYISGGALYVNNTDLYVGNCEFSGNRASYFGGAGYCQYSNVLFENNYIYANNASNDGGGFYITNNKGDIFNNVFYNNRTEDVGGAMLLSSSEMYVDSNEFIENTANNHGGAIYLTSYNCTLSYNRFEGNSADRYHGGAMYITNSHNSQLLRNHFYDNYANEYGGAIHLWYSNIDIKHNTIDNNEGVLFGGGISCQRSHPTIDGNYIIGNNSEKGGGIRCQNNSDPQIANNVIAYNTANAGGGIYIQQKSDPFIVNSSIYENTAITTGGGGFYITDTCKVGIFNSIIWENHFESMSWISELFAHSSECTVEVVQCIANSSEFHADGALAFGGDIINSDPLFEDSLGHLSMYSPAVDEGTIDAWSPYENVFVATLMDIDGESRPAGLAWDIGADESPWDAVSENPEKPEEIAILHALPNPFNSATEIIIDIENPDNDASIQIVDVLGHRVETIATKIESGKRSYIWKPGEDISSGIYFAHYTSQTLDKSIRISLIK